MARNRPVVSMAAICTFWSRSCTRNVTRGPADSSRIFCKATSDSYITSLFLECEGFHQVGNGLLAAQDAKGARGVGPRLHVPAAAGQFAERVDHLGPHRDVGVDHLVVGVGELALDARCPHAAATRRCRSGHSREGRSSPGRRSRGSALRHRDRGWPASAHRGCAAVPISVICLTASMRTPASGFWSRSWSWGMALEPALAISRTSLGRTSWAGRSVAQPEEALRDRTAYFYCSVAATCFWYYYPSTCGAVFNLRRIVNPPAALGRARPGRYVGHALACPFGFVPRRASQRLWSVSRTTGS